MIIGITGSSGAGKSTVCEILQKKYKAKIISADKIAKELSKKGTNYLAEIAQNFGQEILLENGELNRRKLADIIYHNEEKRNLLNNCTFKYISKQIEKEIKEYTNTYKNEKMNNYNNENIQNYKNLSNIQNSEPLIVIDAPLLFEANAQNMCDITIAVISQNKEAQINRIVKRDGIDKPHAIARINAQKSNEFYMNKCNYTIINDDKLLDLESQINNIFKY